MQKKERPKVKASLHPRNRHRQRYDFKALTESSSDLSPFIKPNNYGDESIDFFNPEAVKALNKALLKHHYGVDHWDIPESYLCPPIPGRADYLHHIADLLALSNGGNLLIGEHIKCLDVGVGANCIYPIIGNVEYGWRFVGSDIDPVAIKSARKIVEANPLISEEIELRLQSNPRFIFEGVLKPGEQVDLAICNPPFHSSQKEAQAGTVRKLRNLKHKKEVKPVLNFGGNSNELWCEGGEQKFVKDMIFESRRFSKSCFWFSSLISKEANLKSVYKTLKKVEAISIKTIPMGQGNKVSRIVAWTFLTPAQQKEWKMQRWNKKPLV
ncbi:23S rRNA (adenine(1618)-N(6))-methyltransferase RlmF [Owenweeksia hongkongensis]|uniref:23S rRNA (adenine(1618)-N(6))-methyltransferase RlmF n=1 Tax=Owenweeksia hongkongensis TaxID=253245 RepID=UPI003A8E78A9